MSNKSPVQPLSARLSQRQPGARDGRRGHEAAARGLIGQNCYAQNVSPGLIDTPLSKGMAEVDRQAVFAGAAKKLPARRGGRPEDIAQSILSVATNPTSPASPSRWMSLARA